jgi:hypothetical protein
LWVSSISSASIFCTWFNLRFWFNFILRVLTRPSDALPVTWPRYPLSTTQLWRLRRLLPSLRLTLTAPSLSLLKDAASAHTDWPPKP